jgi:hypothetical protein
MHVPRELVTAIAAEVGALMWANTDDEDDSDEDGSAGAPAPAQ